MEYFNAVLNEAQDLKLILKSRILGQGHNNETDHQNIENKL